MPRQIQKFVARVLILLEYAEHGTGNGDGVLFLYTAHDHAEMLRLDDDGDAARMDLFIDGFRDLRRQPFLNLQAAREHIHEALNLAQADDAAVRDVSDVGLAEKRQQMMLAQAEHLDVPDNDHFV